LAWTIEYTETSRKQLKKLDKQIAERILDYMDSRVSGSKNPRSSGKVLVGSLGGLWRYRVGDYRIICDIQDNTLRVLVVKIGNRGDVYR
jgi:mRNA interferase RelE/StbE